MSGHLKDNKQWTPHCLQCSITIYLVVYLLSLRYMAESKSATHFYIGIGATSAARIRSASSGLCLVGQSDSSISNAGTVNASVDFVTRSFNFWGLFTRQFCGEFF